MIENETNEKMIFDLGRAPRRQTTHTHTNKKKRFSHPKRISNSLAVRVNMVDLDALAIRLSPIAVWVSFHLHSRGGPDALFGSASHQTPAAILQDYGFNFSTWKERKWTLITHLLVHASDEHLAANLFSYAAASMEFGWCTGYNNLFVELQGLDACQALKQMLGSTLVLVLGAILGGLPAEYFVLRKRRNAFARKYSMGLPLAEKTATRVHKALNQDATVMCGASAGIAAITGFNAVYYGRYLSAILHMAPEIIKLLVTETGARPEGSMRVSHAAHLGGFAVGCVLGAIWRILHGQNTPERAARGGRILGHR